MILYLFDIDGTLLWTGGAGSIALEAVFHRRHGKLGSMEKVSAGGKTDPLIIGEMFANTLGREGTAEEIAGVLADYESELPKELTLAEKFRVLPSVPEVIAWLKEKDDVTLAIATGNSEAGAQAKLDHAKLSSHFLCGGYGSDSAERSELVAKAIERAEQKVGHSFERDRIVVVGDTPRDVSAARACGVQVVAVATGRPTIEELRACEPDSLIADLSELLPWHTAEFGA